MGAVTIGVDIGQKRDPTAIAVVEVEYRVGVDRVLRCHRQEDHHIVRHLERLPLGTPYPAVADRVAKVVWDIERLPRATPQLYLDATGVGQPVVDLLRARQLQVRAVYFNHGDRRTAEHGHIALGKAFLVSRLQALLQGERLHLPRTTEAEALAAELLDYEIRVSEDANDRYGAFKVGSHDDLVTALGLAVCYQPPPEIPLGPGTVGYQRPIR